ncbi:thylakoid membrane photosystem I accumulation factor [Acaryochloris sp. IP29b_bin.137]|uniref:thylakoid membrane photosystem I accumulation factor n=1 Tax=Acaryochloris sp. IP29b_bin.137 TaxID=2969217 RepID=UPI00260414F7|nr:thylakoid membrane photosystem I accumulation factor [Acaryochloris sp. IP29b_bin.137]
MIFGVGTRPSWRRIGQRCISVLILVFLLCGFGMIPSQDAIAGIYDDEFDGNIFILYASNAALVPPKVSLAAAIQKEIPTLIMFYTDDSQECKQNALVLTQLQAEYKRQLNLMPIMVDAIKAQSTDDPTDARYYYNGQFVPQFVLVDATGQVVLNQNGKMSFEQLDEPVRTLLGLAPRTEPLVLDRPLFSPSPSADQTFFGEAVRSFQDAPPEE